MRAWTTGAVLALALVSTGAPALAATMDGLATRESDAAMAAHVKGDDKTAEIKLRSAVKTCGVKGCAPKVKTDILVNLGVVEVTLGKAAEAKDAFVQALVIDPGAQVPKALQSAEVTASFEAARKAAAELPDPKTGKKREPKPADVPPPAPPPPAPPPPAPPALEAKPITKLGDSQWVEGLGIVRPSAPVGEPITTPTLTSPPIEGAAPTTTLRVGFEMLKVAPRPDGRVVCDTSTLLSPRLGFSYDGHRRGDSLAFGLDAGYGFAFGSVNAQDPNRPACPPASAGSTDQVTKLGLMSVSLVFNLDYHPPGALNALGVGPLLGARLGLWMATASGTPAPTPFNPDPSPVDNNSTALELAAEYGLHARYRLGAPDRTSGFADASYRIRWSGTRRGNYVRGELGVAFPVVALAVYYETLTAYAGGDITGGDYASLYAKNVALDSTLGAYLGFRF